jgi:hypothetical protein
MKETTKLVIVHYPQKQWATIDMISQVLSTCSVDAWRYLAWKCIDEKGVQRLLPAEHFGPLPVY